MSVKEATRHNTPDHHDHFAYPQFHMCSAPKHLYTPFLMFCHIHFHILDVHWYSTACDCFRASEATLKNTGKQKQNMSLLKDCLYMIKTKQSNIKPHIFTHRSGKVRANGYIFPFFGEKVTTSASWCFIWIVVIKPIIEKCSFSHLGTFTTELGLIYYHSHFINLAIIKELLLWIIMMKMFV